MDVLQTITQLIGTLGFPIVACGVLFYQLRKEQESHEEESKNLAKAIENNTLALTQLTDMLTHQREP